MSSYWRGYGVVERGLGREKGKEEEEESVGKSL